MRLYDTLQKTIVPFRPGSVVSIYTCGITPYDATHIGHAATYLFYDVLQRRLIDDGYSVKWVRNITDVDDDLLRRAREIKINYLDLAAREVARFDLDMKVLGVLPCYSEPRASSAIEEIVDFIQNLVKSGHSYFSNGSVYFSVNSFPKFGELSQLGRSEMLLLAAERGGNPNDPNKKDPLDFVLWQPSASDEPSWISPWGLGRPGWHVECSVLAMRELETPTIDLHGGGSDLIFPHHECEIALSESKTGSKFVNHWMHTAMVEFDGYKMSKSLGNLVFVSELLKKWDPQVIRLAILSNHYRASWQWQDELLLQSKQRLELWKKSGAGEAGLVEVRSYLDEDLDTPSALKILDKLAAQSLGVSQAAQLLGIDLNL